MGTETHAGEIKADSKYAAEQAAGPRRIEDSQGRFFVESFNCGAVELAGRFLILDINSEVELALPVTTR